MLSLSEIARRADLPRRTVQYWFDHGAIDPTLPYQIEVARMLRPFERKADPIAIIKLLSAVFRDCVLDEESQSAEEMEQFRPVVALARAGKPAFLLIAITRDDDNPEATVYPAKNDRELGSVAGRLSRDNPEYPIVIINLTEALGPREAQGAAQRQRRAAVRSIEGAR